MGICEDLRDFGRGFTRIHETLGEDLWGFMRLLERICWGFVRQGFARLWERICDTLGEDSWGFARICETLGDDLLGFMRIHKTLGEDLWGFVRLWERFTGIYKDL